MTNDDDHDKVKTLGSTRNFNAGFIYAFPSNGIYHKLVHSRDDDVIYHSCCTSRLSSSLAGISLP